MFDNYIYKMPKQNQNAGKSRRRQNKSQNRQNGGMAPYGDAQSYVAAVAGAPGHQQAVSENNNAIKLTPVTGGAPAILSPSTVVTMPIKGGRRRSRKNGGNLTNVLVPAVLLAANNYNGYVTKPINRITSTVSSVGRKVRSSMTRRIGGNKKRNNQNNNNQNNNNQNNNNQNNNN